MGQTEERRKWPRLDVALKIRLRPVVAAGEGLEEKAFYTRNISTGGLLFETGEAAALAEGSVFDVEISRPLAKYGFTSSRRLEARGKICRVEARPAEPCGVALEFMAPPRFVSP